MKRLWFPSRLSMPLFRLLNLFKKRGRNGCKNEENHCIILDLLTLLYIVWKIGLDLWYYFSTPHLVTDINIRISKEKWELQQIESELVCREFSERGYVFYWDCIPETVSTGHLNGENSGEVLNDMNSLVHWNCLTTPYHVGNISNLKSLSKKLLQYCHFCGEWTKKVIEING